MQRRYTVLDHAALTSICSELKGKYADTHPHFIDIIQQYQSSGNVDELVKFLTPDEKKAAGIQERRKSSSLVWGSKEKEGTRSEFSKDPDNFKSDGTPVQGMELKVI